MVLASEVSRESVVKFPIAFAFEGSNNKDLQDAAEAVKTEYRQSVRCKTIRAVHFPKTVLSQAIPYQVMLGVVKLSR